MTRRALRLALALALLAFGLNGCAGPSSSPTQAGAANSPFNATFAPGYPDLMLAEIADRLPVASARLEAPDGSFIPAYGIDHEQTVGSDEAAEPSFGVAAGGSSSSGVGAGIGISIPLFGLGAEGPGPFIRSIARFRIPDMARYRAGWQAWQIHLVLGDPAASGRIVTLPAPMPPAL